MSNVDQLVNQLRASQAQVKALKQMISEQLEIQSNLRANFILAQEANAQLTRDKLSLEKKVQELTPATAPAQQDAA